MQYVDGSEIRPGDIVQIDSQYQGIVVASMDLNEYLAGQEHWDYLKEGIMVDTNFAGMVHYTPGAADQLVLLSRPSTPNSLSDSDAPRWST